MATFTMTIEDVRANPRLRYACIAKRAHLYYNDRLVYGIKDLPDQQYRVRFAGNRKIVVDRTAVLEVVITVAEPA